MASGNGRTPNQNGGASGSPIAEQPPVLALVVSGSSLVMLSATAHWAAERDATAIVRLSSSSSMTVRKWLERLMDNELGLHHHPAADVGICFNITTDSSISVFAFISPQRALQATIAEVLAEALLPRLDSAAFSGEPAVSVSVPTIVLSNWSDFLRTEEHGLPPPEAAAQAGSSTVGRRSTGTRLKRARSHSAGGDMANAPSDRAVSPADRRVAEHPTAKHLEFNAASPLQQNTSRSSFTRPAADLAVLNDWILNRRLPAAHVVTSLLCPVCGLMPTSPVIATCCGSTQCHACSVEEPTDGTSTAKERNRTTVCVNCGEARPAGALLPANNERAAAVSTWLREISVLYRDELAELSRGILPVALASPHDRQTSVLSFSPSVHWSDLGRSATHVLPAPTALASPPPMVGYFHTSTSPHDLSPAQLRDPVNRSLLASPLSPGHHW